MNHRDYPTCTVATSSRFPRSTAAFIAALSVLATHSAFSEQIDIAVIAPSTGQASVVVEQVLAGMSISIEDLERDGSAAAEMVIHPIPMQASLAEYSSNNDAPLRMQEWLQGKGIDFVIGGYTSEESATMNELANEWNIPTIVLSPTDPSDALSSPSNLVLEMGDTLNQVYISSVKKWAKENNLSNIALLFDFGDDASYKLGTEVTPQAFSELNLRVEDLAFSRLSHPYYAAEIDKVKKLNPDGVIVAGSPLDTANLVRRIGSELEVPIYITNATGWSNQAAAFALGAYSSDAMASTGAPSTRVYYSCQVWCYPTAENKHLANRLRTELGWSHGAVSSRAIQAYDAIQVINAILRDSDTSDTQRSPWSFDQPIAGYATKFHIEGNRLIAPSRFTQMSAESISLVSP